MSERSKDFLGIPTDIESYTVVPKKLTRFLGDTAGRAADVGKDVTERAVERSKDASQAVIGVGSTAITSVAELFQMLNHEARTRLSGLPGLHDLHPEDDSEDR